MKAREIRGAVISGIRQRRISRGRVDVLAIELQDGRELIPMTLEYDDGSDYGMTFVVRGKKRRHGKRRPD